jgi:hypothetical protein
VITVSAQAEVAKGAELVSRRRRRATTRLSARLLPAAALAAVLLGPAVAHAAVSVGKAELKGSTLRLEGTAASNRTITVDDVAMGTSDGSGRFRIERSGFAAPADCTVDVNDGSATAATARLDGCTVSSRPPASDPALSALTLSQTTVVGGTPVEGTVTLNNDAPSEGVVVTLSSDNPAAATVPPDVTVPAGSRSAGFTVTTNAVTNSQSTSIIGSAGGETRHSTLTVTTQSDADTGSVSLARGGTGEGRVTSSAAGIDCTFTSDSTTGTCSNAFFPAGTEVRLEARPADGSRFLGWEAENSCPDAPKVAILAGSPTSAGRRSPWTSTRSSRYHRPVPEPACTPPLETCSSSGGRQSHGEAGVNCSLSRFRGHLCFRCDLQARR